MSSGLYLVRSALAIVFALRPPCVLMGMTLPVSMAHMRQERKENLASFSYLYRANVLGALAGAVLTPIFLIEVFGFRSTNLIGVAANLFNSLLSYRLSR